MGRCTTTAIFICCGSCSDPIQRVAKELLSAYFSLMRAELAIAWSRIKTLMYDPMVEGKPDPIKHVTAVISSVVYLLALAVWHPFELYRWVECDAN